MLYEHGGDIYGRKIKLDFSANINPLGMPESVKNAAASAAAESAVYPDPHCRELVKRLSQHESVSEDNIVCGNGADDLIYRIVHAVRPKCAVIPEPTFSEYAKALREVGCEVREYIPEQIITGLTDSVDMLILCNPGNPTGLLIRQDELEIICEKCVRNDIVFLCDECFIDLCDDTHDRSAKRFMNDNVIVLKAFTKTYAMAGLRLGYALFGSSRLASDVRESGQYWSVSTVAQAAGIAALDERKYVEEARRIIAEERKYLSDELRGYGFSVCTSDADFILFRCGYELDGMLLNEGILIRSCADYSGLGEGFFRIAVRLHEENETLIKAIGKVTGWRRT